MSVCLLFSACLYAPAHTSSVVLADFFSLPFRQWQAHGSENKGHWFLSIHDELSLSHWSSLQNSLRERERVENKPISYQQRLICVKPSQAELFSLSCSMHSVVLRGVKPNWLFGRGVKGFWVQALTSICHLDPVHEKVTSLSLTWSCVAFVSSLKSVYRPLNQGHNTDPHSVTGE